MAKKSKLEKIVKDSQPILSGIIKIVEKIGKIVALILLIVCAINKMCLISNGTCGCFDYIILFFCIALLGVKTEFIKSIITLLFAED